LLVPYPAAAENHQYHNARAFADTGAARLLVQSEATAETLVSNLVDLVESRAVRQTMQKALERWHSPRAAELIAEAILENISEQAQGNATFSQTPAPAAR
jgi:UDP-N-acetylglucosamine--N-acetylmuramyl-(pentapeptide) pyrophosphoryl-undecaprenol N-acetylglucosamine transferase